MALVNFNVSSLRNSKSSQCFSMNWIVEAFVPFVEVDDFCYLLYIWPCSMCQWTEFANDCQTSRKSPECVVLARPCM